MHFTGKVQEGTLSWTTDRWFLSAPVGIPNPPAVCCKKPRGGKIVGLKAYAAAQNSIIGDRNAAAGKVVFSVRLVFLSKLVIMSDDDPVGQYGKNFPQARKMLYEMSSQGNSGNEKNVLLRRRKISAMVNSR